MLVFDVNTLPRPERSGFLGVLVALSCLFGIIAPSGIADDICIFMPGRCTEVRPEQPKRGHYRSIIFDPNGHGKNKECTCHIDIRLFGKPEEHIHTYSELTCDSEFTTPREWTIPPVPPPCPDNTSCVSDAINFMFSAREGGWTMRSLRPSEGEYRWHCALPERKP